MKMIKEFSEKNVTRYLPSCPVDWHVLSGGEIFISVYLHQLCRKHWTSIWLFLTEVYDHSPPVEENPSRHPLTCLGYQICITTSPTLISARLWSIILTMFMIQEKHLSSHLTSWRCLFVQSVTNTSVMDGDLQIVTSSTSLSHSLRSTNINKTKF